MARYHSVQVRMAENDFTEGKKLLFEGKEYAIGEIVPQTLQPKNVPIGAIMNGYTRQVSSSSRPSVALLLWKYRGRALGRS